MGVAACRSIRSEGSCGKAACSLEDHDVQGYYEDDLLLHAIPTCSDPEALYQRELRQRKQWARDAGMVPAASSAAPASTVDWAAAAVGISPQTSSAPSVDYEALFKRDLKEIQQRAKGVKAPPTSTATSQANEVPAAAPWGMSSAPAAVQVNEQPSPGRDSDPSEPSDVQPSLFISAEVDKTGETKPIAASDDEAPEANEKDKIQEEVLQQKQPPLASVVSAPPRTKKKVQPRQKPRGGDGNEDVASTVSGSTASRSTGGRMRRKEPANTASCPSSKKDAEFEKELKEVKKRLKNGEKAQAVVDVTHITGFYDSIVSVGERDCKKNLFISFYREQYAKIGTLDVSQYDDSASLGLSIKNGHTPMPRPKAGSVDLPPDYKKPVGNISPKEFRKYNCESKRMLLCVHGDLFDVSDRPDKYSKDGPYWAMVGHDITWGLVCGNDDAVTYDQYFDVFKIEPKDMMERKLQGLISWWCFYDKEYGAPVGRLDVYEEEWKLPTPPEVGDVCCVM